jgi:hypothetical protein
MAIVERHTAPDGQLCLIVDLADDGDWSVGFDGFEWHTHGDLLAHEYGGSPETAVRSFVDNILASRRVIVISRLAGKMRDVWVTDDPSFDEMEYAYPNETIEKRLWNGEPVA